MFRIPAGTYVWAPDESEGMYMPEDYVCFCTGVDADVLGFVYDESAWRVYRRDVIAL